MTLHFVINSPRFNTGRLPFFFLISPSLVNRKDANYTRTSFSIPPCIHFWDLILLLSPIYKYNNLKFVFLRVFGIKIEFPITHFKNLISVNHRIEVHTGQRDFQVQGRLSGCTHRAGPLNSPPTESPH